MVSSGSDQLLCAESRFSAPCHRNHHLGKLFCIRYTISAGGPKLPASVSLSVERCMNASSTMCFAGHFVDMPPHARPTPNYAAPEVMLGHCGHQMEWVDARAHDVWGLACLVLRLFFPQWWAQAATGGIFDWDWEVGMQDLCRAHEEWVRHHPACLQVITDCIHRSSVF